MKYYYLLTAIIFAAVFSLLPAVNCQAQERIQKVVDQICKNNDDGIIYVEKRNAHTKKVWSRKLVIQWNSGKEYDQLLDAIKKEKPNSVSYETVNNRVIKICFDHNGKSARYTLIRGTASGQWMLECRTYDEANRPDDESSNIYFETFPELELPDAVMPESVYIYL